MQELSIDLTSQVAGAANITADYTEIVSPTIATYEHMFITLTNDGTLPPEFQARIDAGASWEEMAPWLTMYSIIINNHPELFK